MNPILDISFAINDLSVRGDTSTSASAHLENMAGRTGYRGSMAAHLVCTDTHMARNHTRSVD